MGFKLTSEEKTTKAALVAELSAGREALVATATNVNEKIAELNRELDAAHNAYNAILTKVVGWVEDIVAERDSEFEEKYEEWTESDRGQEVSAWIEEYRDATSDLEECDFDLIVLPDVPEVNEDEILADLPDAPA